MGKSRGWLELTGVEHRFLSVYKLVLRVRHDGENEAGEGLNIPGRRRPWFLYDTTLTAYSKTDKYRSWGQSPWIELAYPLALQLVNSTRIVLTSESDTRSLATLWHPISKLHC